MDMQSVSSSNILEIGYDEETETLAVRFHRGTLYHYQGVSQETFEGLRDAPSVGKYFNSHIRDGYAFTKEG